MEFNAGKAVKDKYGFYLYLGFNLKKIICIYESGAGKEIATVWIGYSNPTTHCEKTDSICVYVITEDYSSLPSKEKRRIPPIMTGFKTREAAKKWANANIQFQIEAERGGIR